VNPPAYVLGGPGAPAASDVVVALALGAGLSACIAYFAYWRGSLTAPGARAAVAVGTLVIGLGGWAAGAILLAFFLTSNRVSRLTSAAKLSAVEAFAKGGRRDRAQVLANGGVAAVCATMGALSPDPAWFAALTGAIAAATADTWATEIGTLKDGRPRLVTTGRPVPAGTSGAVSARGLAAAAGGAALIGLLAGLLHGSWPWWLGLTVGLVAGLAGSLFDSVLGATAQARFHCAACGVATEAPVHRCGSRSEHVRGWRWLDNDAVNWGATLAGAGTGFAML
jgi:uncharacterized protein (TIGR00297 family)